MMNRRMMSVLAVFATGVAASIYRSRRAKRQSEPRVEDAAAKTRWEDEGGTVASRPVDASVTQATGI